MAGQPHDLLFREVFSDPSEAEPLLRWILPPEVADPVDWSTLALVPPSSIDPALAEREPDLVFAVDYRGEARLILHLVTEHQSRVDRTMVVRFLGHLVRAWDHALARGDPLPILVPILVSHDERGWTGPLAFPQLLGLELADADRLGPFLPRFDILIDDLARIPEDELGRRDLQPYGEIALRMLKVLRRSPRPLEDLARWLPLLDRISKARLPRLARLFTYFLTVSDADPRDAVGVIAPLGEQEEAMGMTAADRLRAEGRVEGEAKGRAELLLSQLRLKFPGQLTTELEARLHAADIPTLDRWARRVLTEDTLEAVLD